MVTASLINSRTPLTDNVLDLIKKHHKQVAVIYYDLVFKWGYRETLLNHIRKGMNSYSIVCDRYAQAYYSDDKDPSEHEIKLADIDETMTNILRS